MTDKNEKGAPDEERTSDSDLNEKAADDGKVTEVPEQEEKEGPVDTADDLKQQLDNMSDRYIRLMAEFDNFKKRVSRDYERLVESANEKLMLDMIDVRENFERALRSSEAGTENGSFYEGMKLIFNKFEGALNKHGLEVFAENGEPFDPQLHDALMKTPHESIPEDHIAEIYEKGYRLKEKVIKHARVIVSSGKPQENS